MTTLQKVVKYLAMAFAVYLAVSIIVGILSAVGLLGGFFGSDAVTDDVTKYEISSDITALDIKINAADFTVKQADTFSLESNLKDLTVTEKNGTLTIKEKKRFGVYSGAVLTLYVPKETVFKKAEITSGAGRLTVDTLSADSLELDLGAGEVKIKELTVTSYADIDGGAGKITISGGSLRNLDLDMGVGQLNLTSALSGKSELDLGVGESNLTFIGSKDDYTVDIEKGLGNITVDGKNMSSYKSTNGQNRIDIDGGVGAVNVFFTDSGSK